MPFLLRGALVEYGSDFLGPFPNVVIFQFNPEQLTRNIHIPPRPTESRGRETSQAGEKPLEKISLTAHFSAADRLNESNPLALMFGIGPQLAALEKMVYPAGKLSGLLGKAIDAVGKAITGRSSAQKVVREPIPRESYPRLLFIWGLTRVLPVVIESMSITEQHFDLLLNPIQAEVSLGLIVNLVDQYSSDEVAKGAQEYTNLATDAKAVANLANTVQQVVELIPF